MAWYYHSRQNVDVKLSFSALKIIHVFVARELTNSMDIMATIADFEETTPPNPLDGKSIKSILLDETAKTPHEFMFHYCGKKAE